MKKKNILVLLGPNLNLMGVREKSIYGEETAESIKEQIIALGEELGLNCEVFQSNWEGALIDKIHDSKDSCDGAVINAGALAHYSYALRDAISFSRMPFVEAHMTNISSREDFRKHSIISDVCAGYISGFGKNSYFLALRAIKELV
ncbi:MAG: type II 3-dehydroquinate dehydratase [Clostridia bacterium]|nr:type II 3-dehydroquinate dehydratase [Clostridia bacterium]